MVNIIISGYTASGKSRFGGRLARELDFEYISASQFLLDRIGYPAAERHRAWSADFGKISAIRDSSSVDLEVDQELVSLVRKNDRLVVDSWALPWLTNESTCNIWISCDASIRYRKAQLSALPGQRYTLREYQAIVDRKDSDFRCRLMKLYGFSYGPDPAIFNSILDNSSFFLDEDSSLSDSMAGKFFAELLAAATGDIDTRYGRRGIPRDGN